MTLTSKTRLGKRKLEMKEVRKENHTATSKKHDKNCLEPKKTSASSHLKSPLEALQFKYDVLDIENKKNVEEIGILKQKIKLMEENQIGSKKPDQKSIGVQTVEFTKTEEMLFCAECEYPAEDGYDLGEHMVEYHSESSHKKLSCHYCDDSFDNKNSLMKHRKEIHADKVQPCIFFSVGTCHYGDALCWFNHEKTCSEVFQKVSQLICRICNKEYKTRSDFMNHRKNEHTEGVPMCRNYLNGSCEYVSCWFRHLEAAAKHKDVIEEENITEKLVNMMEKLAQRLSMLEK